MKLEYITKPEFDFVKDNLVDWFYKKLKKDPDTIFQFSSDLTKEDRNFIYQNSDNFIIEKSKVLEIDNFEKIESDHIKNENEKIVNNNNGEKTEESNEIKYEIIMRAGRKYYNKLQRYPIQNMGVINVIESKIDFQMKLLSTIFVMNSFMLFYMLGK